MRDLKSWLRDTVFPLWAEKGVDRVGGGFYEAGFALAAAVDLAVDAVKITDLIGVEVYTDRNPAGTTAEDWVDEPVVLEEPGVVGVEGEGGHGGG